MGKRTAVTTEKAPGGAPSRVGGGPTGFESRDCGQGQEQGETNVGTSAKVVEAIETLIAAGQLVVWDPDSQELEEVKSVCLNGACVQLNLPPRAKHQYRVGQVLTVLVQRDTIYSHDGYSPAEHESTQRLLVLQAYKGQAGTYGVKNLRSGRILRFEEAKSEGNFGSLRGGLDGKKHIRWNVLDVVSVKEKP